MIFPVKKIIKAALAIILIGFLIFVSIATLYLRSHAVTPIIMYHAVTPEVRDRDNLLAVSAATFESQMRFLHQHKYNVISLKQLAGLMKSKMPIPPKTVVITFDDGYKNNLTEALPVLKKYNLPATIFVAPLEISRVPYYLNWEELRALSKAPLIDIGAHTMHHAFLPEIKDEKVLYYEIRGSKEALEKKLGKNIYLFSYPAGGFNKKIRQIVIDSGYLAAVTSKPGIRYPSNDIYALKRIRISETRYNSLVFWLKVSSFYTPIQEWQRRHKDRNILHGY